MALPPGFDASVEAAGLAISDLKQRCGPKGSTSRREAEEYLTSARDMLSWVADLAAHARRSPRHTVVLARLKKQLEAVIATLTVSVSPIRARRRVSGSSSRSSATPPPDSKPAPAASHARPAATASRGPPPRLAAPARAVLERIDGDEDTPTELARFELFDDLGRPVALRCDDELEREVERAERMQALHADVVAFDEASRDMAALMVADTERLETVRDTVDMAARRAEAGVFELAEAAKYQSRARTKGAGAVGTLVGGGVGIIGGPKGMALGAVAGGGITAWITSKLGKRLGRKIEAIKEQRRERARERQRPDST